MSLGWPSGKNRLSFEDPAYLVTPNPSASYFFSKEFDKSDDMGISVNPTGTHTPAIGNGVLSVYMTGQSGTQCAGTMWPHSLAVGDCVETSYRLFCRSTSMLAFPGIILSDGVTTGSAMLLMGAYHQSNYEALPQMSSGTFASISGLGGFDLYIRYMTFWASSVRARIVRTASTTYKYQMSPDGVTWVGYGNDYEITWAGTPTYVGLGGTPWGTTGGATFSFDYIRVYTP